MQLIQITLLPLSMAKSCINLSANFQILLPTCFHSSCCTCGDCLHGYYCFPTFPSLDSKIKNKSGCYCVISYDFHQEPWQKALPDLFGQLGFASQVHLHDIRSVWKDSIFPVEAHDHKLLNSDSWVWLLPHLLTPDIWLLASDHWCTPVSDPRLRSTTLDCGPELTGPCSGLVAVMSPY